MIIIYKTSVTGEMSLNHLLAHVHWRNENTKKQFASEPLFRLLWWVIGQIDF